LEDYSLARLNIHLINTGYEHSAFFSISTPLWIRCHLYRYCYYTDILWNWNFLCWL